MLAKISIRYDNILLYPDGRTFCKYRNKFLCTMDNSGSEFPYFNICGTKDGKEKRTKRVLCKNLIAETFILGRPIKKSEIINYKDGDIFNFSVGNLIVEKRYKDARRKQHNKKVIKVKDIDRFYDWNDTAIYC